MKRLAQLLNVVALFAFLALAGSRLEQAAFEAELLGRVVAEERETRPADQSPPCLMPAEPAGPGGARKESGERELSGADGEVERIEPLPPDALAMPLGERPARLAGIRQPHLRVNGSADAFGARC